MDGGSGLNILYTETLDAIGIDRSCVRSTRAPFHSIMLGKQAMPLGKNDLPVTFGNPINYRMETLTFKVVGFHGTYHVILRWPCAYECEVECCEHAAAIIASTELEAIWERTAEEPLDSKWLAGSFEPAEDDKEIPVDPSSPDGKVL
ncbi:uncharacterized protein [Miscanthus floridulus]|uniref:uncharacterized protein n=1 Tax=Miscanthus floridulus TaxID=154761 RepID=UPI003459EA43